MGQGVVASQGWKTDLSIVSDILLHESDATLVASEGRPRYVKNWIPADEDLAATDVVYQVPPSEG